MVFSEGLFGCEPTRGVVEKSQWASPLLLFFALRCTGGPTCQTDLVDVEGACDRAALGEFEDEVGLGASSEQESTYDGQ